MPEHQTVEQESPSFTGSPIENRAKVSAKQRSSGKILHTVAGAGMETVYNNVEGGEKLRESEQILMAMGTAGKRVFRSKRQRQMNRSSAGNRATGGTGTSARSSGRRETTTDSNKPGEKAKKKHLKDSKDKKHIREKRRATARRRRLAKLLRRRRRKRYEDEEYVTIQFWRDIEMEYDMHSNPQAYRAAIEKEGYPLSDLVIERVINLQMRYRWQNRPFNFSDYLLDDEHEVLRRIDEAENNLSTLMSERLCESFV